MRVVAPQGGEHLQVRGVQRVTLDDPPAHDVREGEVDVGQLLGADLGGIEDATAGKDVGDDRRAGVAREKELGRRSRDLALKFMSKPFGIGDVLGTIEEYLVTARERETRRRHSVDPAFDPPLGVFTDELAQSFALPKVSDRIENIFIVSKLYTVFASFQDEEDAVRSFS